MCPLADPQLLPSTFPPACLSACLPEDSDVKERAPRKLQRLSSQQQRGQRKAQASQQPASHPMLGCQTCSIVRLLAGCCAAVLFYPAWQ